MLALKPCDFFSFRLFIVAGVNGVIREKYFFIPILSLPDESCAMDCIVSETLGWVLIMLSMFPNTFISTDIIAFPDLRPK